MSEVIIDGSPLQESAEYVREKAGNYCGTSPKGINDRQVLLTALCGISGKVSPKWGHGLFGGREQSRLYCGRSTRWSYCLSCALDEMKKRIFMNLE